jgi:hypothetical protein
MTADERILNSHLRSSPNFFLLCHCTAIHTLAPFLILIPKAHLAGQVPSFLWDRVFGRSGIVEFE